MPRSMINKDCAPTAAHKEIAKPKPSIKTTNILLNPFTQNKLKTTNAMQTNHSKGYFKILGFKTTFINKS